MNNVDEKLGTTTVWPTGKRDFVNNLGFKFDFRQEHKYPVFAIENVPGRLESFVVSSSGILPA
jgi:hypothetical protein